jgi:hypothetical protein
MYVYQWLNQGDQRVQTAWNKWTFKGVDRVISCAVLQGCVYMLFQIGNKLVLEQITLDPTDLSQRYISLDHRLTQSGRSRLASSSTPRSGLLGPCPTPSLRTFADAYVLIRECPWRGRCGSVAREVATSSPGCLAPRIRVTQLPAPMGSSGSARRSSTQVGLSRSYMCRTRRLAQCSRSSTTSRSSPCPPYGDL